MRSDDTLYKVVHFKHGETFRVKGKLLHDD